MKRNVMFLSFIFYFGHRVSLCVSVSFTSWVFSLIVITCPATIVSSFLSRHPYLVYLADVWLPHVCRFSAPIASGLYLCFVLLLSFVFGSYSFYTYTVTAYFLVSLAKPPIRDFYTHATYSEVTTKRKIENSLFF